MSLQHRWNSVGWVLTLLAGEAFTFAQAPPVNAPAEGPKVSSAEIEQLIIQLGNDDILQRTAAKKQLESIGDPALESLKKTVETTQDTEVRISGKAIIKSISDGNSCIIVLIRACSNRPHRDPMRGAFPWTNNIPSKMRHIMPKGNEYAEGKIIILILGLARLVDMLTGTNTEIIGFSHHYRANLYMLLLLSVVNIALNLVLIKSYGSVGSACATLISMTVFNVAKLIYIYIMLPAEGFNVLMLRCSCMQENERLSDFQFFFYSIMSFVLLFI